MWEKMPLADKSGELKPFFRDETQFLQFFLAELTPVPTTVSVEYLQHIARLRLSLTMATSIITDCLSGEIFFKFITPDSFSWLAVKIHKSILDYSVVADNKIPDEAQDFLNMVIKLCEDSGNDWYRVYLMRKLSHHNGVDCVQTLVKQPKFSWLFPTEIHEQVQNHTQ